MGALPKIRISKARRGKRRAHHALKRPNLVTCPQCHELRLHHHVCPSCGAYRGVQVIEAKEETSE